MEGRTHRCLSWNARARREAAPAQNLGENGTAESSGSAEYSGLLLAAVEFFHTGRPPFDVAETLEIFEFMTAAQLSKERNGAEVSLAELRK